MNKKISIFAAALLALLGIESLGKHIHAQGDPSYAPQYLIEQRTPFSKVCFHAHKEGIRYQDCDCNCKNEHVRRDGTCMRCGHYVTFTYATPNFTLKQ